MNNQIRMALVEAAKQYIYQLDDYPESAVHKQIELELEEILDLNEEQVLVKRLAYIGIGSQEDYLNKIIETSEGIVLAGIRHMNGNPEKPFIQMWPGFLISDLSVVVRQVCAHFDVFRPIAVHFWTRPDSNRYAANVIQQRFIGKLDELLTFDSDLVIPEDYFNWYEQQYKDFHTSRPDLTDRVPMNPKEDMDRCLVQGLLFQMMSDELIAGLIAGENETFLGEKSVYLDEILIAGDFRGKGLGVRMLGSFVKRLDAKYLTCHIDSINLPSTKTALRVGETIFSQECSVDLLGLQ